MRLDRPLKELVITWPFGATSDDPRLKGVKHGGIDLRAPEGTPVYAVADASMVGLTQGAVGYGNYARLGLGIVTLDDVFGGSITGNVVVYLAHLREIPVTRPCKRRELIAWSGDTGFTTGAHLHLEIRVDGVRVDPVLYVEGLMDETEKLRRQVAALQAQVDAMTDAGKGVRFGLEQYVIRALNKADDLEAEAGRIRDGVRRYLNGLVSTVDGDAYRVEILGGGDRPPNWKG